MKNTVLAVATVLAAAALPAAAGPYDQPWSVVQSGDNSEVRKESRVAITKIDDVTPKNARRGDPLTPGKHKVRVSYDTAKGVVTDNFRELDMDLEPCVMYRIVANYTNKTSPEWKPVVHTEPIPDCKKKFKK